MSGTRLVLLGTAGGPLPSTTRAGISQALVVGGRAYVIDCGSGVTRQLRRARLLSSLHRVLITHLHSDHICDYFNLFLLGWPILQSNPPVHIYGPGPAGGLPDPAEQTPSGVSIPVVCPDNPTPGLIELTNHQFAAHAYDLNVRMREAGRANLADFVMPHELVVPTANLHHQAGLPSHNLRTPNMEPFVVTEDHRVRISAILVQHPPTFPAFAYRFDTDDGAVVISGDTAPCDNLIRLAQGADILVHEVFSDGTPAAEEDSWEARQREHHLRVSHTSLREVGGIAAAAEVKRLVLTHFIPGDDTRPDDYWNAGIGAAFAGEVIVGRDLAEISL